MHYFGDESGNFHQVATNGDDIFAMALVAGDPPHPARCANHAIAKSATGEAKWSDMNAWEKERFITCLDSLEAPIEMSYFTLSYTDVVTIPAQHRLFLDNGGIDPTVVADVLGIGYGCLLRSMNVSKDLHPILTFDRFIGNKQSNGVITRIEEMVDLNTVRAANSRMTTGIQSADCIAGAAREDRLKGSEWLSRLRLPATDIRNSVQGRLEMFLSGKSTDP
ncbi:MAG: hypothetical protein ABEI52_01410 [Halobacteriaceae archaeon]